MYLSLIKNQHGIWVEFLLFFPFFLIILRVELRSPVVTYILCVCDMTHFDLDKYHIYMKVYTCYIFI